MSAGIHPWERQDGESPRAFEAFAAYLEMGADRSLRAVGQKLVKSYALISRWSAAHRWVERAAAYDAEIRRQAYTAASKKARKMLDRHICTALELQSKAIEALDEITPEDLDPKALLSYIVTAAKLEREARADLVRMTAPNEDAGRAGVSLADEIAAAWERRRRGEG